MEIIRTYKLDKQEYFIIKKDGEYYGYEGDKDTLNRLTEGSKKIKEAERELQKEIREKIGIKRSNLLKKATEIMEEEIRLSQLIGELLSKKGLEKFLEK